jgi:hypothetical protein
LISSKQTQLRATVLASVRPKSDGALASTRSVQSRGDAAQIRPGATAHLG